MEKYNITVTDDEVRAFIKDYFGSMIDDDSFKSSIIRIAETALGEYDFAKLIGFIDVEKKSNKC